MPNHNTERGHTIFTGRELGSATRSDTDSRETVQAGPTPGQSARQKNLWAASRVGAFSAPPIRRDAAMSKFQSNRWLPGLRHESIVVVFVEGTPMAPQVNDV
jgi:hypothetical protein